MITRVPLSSLVGHTPVTVRFHNGQEFSFKSVESMGGGMVKCDLRGRGHAELSGRELVEVLPAKQTPTPHAAQSWHWWSTGDGRPKNYDLAELRDNNDETILTLYGGSGFDALGRGPKDRRNARLIASAPALLALVERVAELEDGQLISVISDARALLAQLKTP